jgi:hypothetical protein
VPNTKPDPADPAQDRILEDAIENAIDLILGRIAPEGRARALRDLREELERCLVTAPIDGPVMTALQVRARIAASLASYGLAGPAAMETELPAV